ncbi:NAD(P)-binding protein [Punctularia strigosozonata HHB-11173 SS5]|uniref:NAD(P)-binding protein n=1 Tax=Punctularia strigosozonata (strain HHB-11173) TaxID=741275 RepID=UPI00044165F1|nr:NAD(P)-binding protein [Punctularia strigosozonata HHB-11173 SS5]EIN11956.1 NAD(P)-binding protein [Punctularia strigosozonata HHB-11173 SS5]
MKVLVLGLTSAHHRASGFIGLPISQALVRAGHVVYGVTRSEKNAKKLAEEEILPVVADYGQPELWLKEIATLDVIIDAVGGSSIATLSETIRAAVASAAEALRSPLAGRLAYIYTSGTWVHGDNRTETVSDATACTRPASLVAWRVQQEQRVLAERAFDGIVIRPGLVYGRSGSITGMLFANAAKGEVKWFGTPGGRYAVVHVDDLAELYVLAAEKAGVVAGKAIDAVNEQSESVDDLLYNLVRVAGAKGSYEYIKPSNAFEEAIATTSLIRPYLARSLLEWRQRKAGLVDGLPIYYRSWQTSYASA